VPWDDRPRRLRLALARVEAGTSESLRWALVFVNKQQDDPLELDSADEIAKRPRSGRRGGSAPAAKSLGETPLPRTERATPEHFEARAAEFAERWIPRIRQMDADFRGGLPNPFATGTSLPREEYPAWDEALRRHGLPTIEEAHEQGIGERDELWWKHVQQRRAS
jgi:hypothetical protein